MTMIKRFSLFNHKNVLIVWWETKFLIKNKSQRMIKMEAICLQQVWYSPRLVQQESQGCYIGRLAASFKLILSEKQNLFLPYWSTQSRNDFLKCRKFTFSTKSCNQSFYKQLFSFFYIKFSWISARATYLLALSKSKRSMLIKYETDYRLIAPLLCSRYLKQVNSFFKQWFFSKWHPAPHARFSVNL